MDKDEKYIDIADKLKNLEKVEASHNFTHNLQAKIIEFESEKRKEHSKRNEETKGGFLRDFLGNMQFPWIVPAAGFTILVFFVFYITYQNKNALEINNENQVTDNSQVEKKLETTKLNERTEEQTLPAVTENKEIESGINPQSNENNINKNNTGNPLSDKEITREKSQVSTFSDKGSDKEPVKTEKIIKKEQVAIPSPVEEFSGDADKSEELAKTENQNVESEENKASDFSGKVTNEKSRTMANVKPGSKDTNSSKKDKNDYESIMMMKIKKIDKKALEKIQEEISK